MEDKKNLNAYNPIDSVRRDFGTEANGPNAKIYRDKNGRAIIKDADLNTVFAVYRNSTKPGTLLDLGAGPTHLHYMCALEDRLTHITALDFSKKNLQAVAEFLDANDGKDKEYSFVSPKDLEVLRLTAESQCAFKKEKNICTGKEILKSIKSKICNEDGSYDLLEADMHNIDQEQVLGNKKFDNVLIGFSFFANNAEQIVSLLVKVRNRLNPGGRLIVAEFKTFDNAIIEQEKKYEEDDNVNEFYGDYFDYSLEKFEKEYLPEAGFSRSRIKVEEKKSVSEKVGDENLIYVFVTAEK